MRLILLWVSLVVFVSLAKSQDQWTVPIAITDGLHNDLHPCLAYGGSPIFSPGDQFLAFSRDGKNICVLRTTANGIAWGDTVCFVTTDSLDNDFPSLYCPSWTADGTMMVWQSRRNGNLDIWFSKYQQSSWSAPMAVATHANDDTYPHITGVDSYEQYYLTWERRGQVLFSEYSGGTWSAPQVLSQTGDTLNHNPQVKCIRVTNLSYQPLVIWERQKAPDTTYAVMCVFRNVTAWTAPDTIVSVGNNRRPRFFKDPFQQAMVYWERVFADGNECYGGVGEVQAGRFRLTGGGSVLWDSTEHMRNASVNALPLVTHQGVWAFNPYIVAAWESPTVPSDSIGVVRWPTFFMPSQKLGVNGAIKYRNPDVSHNLSYGGGLVRIWVVWEALVSGKWRLFGSNTIVPIPGDVEESTELPQQADIEQNYPNPFNASTVISYRLTVNSFVTFKVFDLLGREVETLVNEYMQPGSYQVTWNATRMVSGVYYYRLTTGDFAETKMMLLIK